MQFFLKDFGFMWSARVLPIRHITEMMLSRTLQMGERGRGGGGPTHILKGVYTEMRMSSSQLIMIPTEAEMGQGE